MTRSFVRTLALAIPLITYVPIPIDAQPAAPVCPVTAPNHHAAPLRSDPIPGSGSGWHGNTSVGTFLWTDGKVVFRPGGPGFVLADGSLKMKFFWLKTAGTRLAVSGHRLDDPAVTLRWEMSQAYDPKGFQPSYLIFATPGCWKVTATAGAETLEFVTDVVKIGAGPTSRRDR